MPKGVLPNNGTPVKDGISASHANIVTVIGLEPNTEYDLYGRRFCTQDTGAYFPVVPFKTAPTCNEYFYDLGGPNIDYPVNAGDYATILCPDEDWQAMELVFEEFEIGPNDILGIFDGNIITPTTLIRNFSGNSIDPSFIASGDSRCLTANFRIF